MIHRCALGLISKRGATVVAPTISTLTDAERDFLARHVDELRSHCNSDGAVFSAFTPGSNLEEDLQQALTSPDPDFVSHAVTMVNGLAATMLASPKAAPICLIALVTSSDSVTGGGAATQTTLLKLDARVEAAKLVEAQGTSGIRLEVFKDLLPAPGELQKGFSWPDPRQPQSSLIFHDTNQGDAALYFPNAFGLSVSSKAVETEKALLDELVKQLGTARAAQAVAMVDETGGRADAVVLTIKEHFDDFEATARPLGANGAMPGIVRPGHLGLRPLIFRADGIELRVPASRMGSIESAADGDGYITTIRTSTPLLET